MWIDWIADRLPDEPGRYLVTAAYPGKVYVTTAEYRDGHWSGVHVVAWAEAPEPYSCDDHCPTP